jgi:hypothetical protein
MGCIMHTMVKNTRKRGFEEVEYKKHADRQQRMYRMHDRQVRERKKKKQNLRSML